MQWCNIESWGWQRELRMASKCLSCVVSQSQAETDSLCKFGNPDAAASMWHKGKTLDTIFTRKLNILLKSANYSFHWCYISVWHIFVYVTFCHSVISDIIAYGRGTPKIHNWIYTKVNFDFFFFSFWKSTSKHWHRKCKMCSPVSALKHWMHNS